MILVQANEKDGNLVDLGETIMKTIARAWERFFATAPWSSDSSCPLSLSAAWSWVHGRIWRSAPCDLPWRVAMCPLLASKESPGSPLRSHAASSWHSTDSTTPCSIIQALGICIFERPPADICLCPISLFPLDKAILLLWHGDSLRLGCDMKECILTWSQTLAFEALWLAFLHFCPQFMIWANVWTSATFFSCSRTVPVHKPQ